MSTIQKQTINQNGTEASLVIVSSSSAAADIVDALALPGHKSVILLFGGADQLDASLADDIAELLVNGLLPVAASAASVIIDGGTKAGVMELMGTARSEGDNTLPLIGVAPEALVSYPGKSGDGLTPLDPGHSHFILVKGAAAWGAETSTIFRVAAYLQQPIVAILMGGGKIAVTEIADAVRQRIPVIIVTGSGGFADELFTACQPGQQVTDPVIQMIATQGDLYFFALETPAEVFGQTVQRFFGQDMLLQSAWGDFSNFDLNAGYQQQVHKNYQGWIIIIGLLTAFLGIFYQVFLKDNKDPQYADSERMVRGLLVLLPIVLSILIAASNKFKNGMKWIFFRAGAEAIKREIYAYRTRTGAYHQSAAILLSQRISLIVQKAMKTDISDTYIRPYKKTNKFPPAMTGDLGNDDGLSRLDAEHYIEYRVKSQLHFYEKKIKTMNSWLSAYNLAVYIITGAGTLLAVLKLQVWIALSTALVSAIGTWLGYQQWDNTRSKYNQCAADLKDIVNWWDALMPADQFKQENKDKLVTTAEQTLQNEYDGWTQQMQQTLSEMAQEQQKRKKP